MRNFEDKVKLSFGFYRMGKLNDNYLSYQSLEIYLLMLIKQIVDSIIYNFNVT